MIPLAEQAACIERELALRRRVMSGRITQDAADRGIARMEAVLATLRGFDPEPPPAAEALERARIEGWRAAREAAARIVETELSPDCQDAAVSIRALPDPDVPWI